MTEQRPDIQGRGAAGGWWPESQRWLEAGIDFDNANAARMYDFFLGGAHNFAVDREVAAQVQTGNPDIAAVARTNRAFLGRVVRWCVERGIDQFLDLGSGVPTVGNVHEIAHTALPGARVAYVDFEPVAVAHAAEIIDLARIGGTVSITRADLRDPDSVLTSPGVTRLLDLTRPVALLAIAVLHFVDDTDLHPAFARYRAELAPGSVLAFSHASDDQDDPAVAQRVRAAAAGYAHSATPLLLRSRPQLHALLDGLDVVAPGLVDVRDWPHPASTPPPATDHRHAGTSTHGASTHGAGSPGAGSPGAGSPGATRDGAGGYGAVATLPPLPSTP